MIGGAMLMLTEQDKVGVSFGLHQARHVWGDVMAAKRTWSELDERTRKLIIAVAVADGILEVAALIDIKRRPASQIRARSGCGPPWWPWSTPLGSCRSHTSSSGGGNRGRYPADMHAAREMTASIVYDTGLSVAH
jgi:hypothetical protein